MRRWLELVGGIATALGALLVVTGLVLIVYEVIPPWHAIPYQLKIIVGGFLAMIGGACLTVWSVNS